MELIDSMRVFVRVAELKSFRLAAREMSMSNASATRCVANLEARLNTRLLDRSTRCVSVTVAGLNYLAGCRGWLENLEQLETALCHADAEPRGALRIIAAGALPLPMLSAIVHGFRRQYPQVDVRLTLSDDSGEFPSASHDIAIVDNTKIDDKKFSVHPMWTSPLICVASTAYLELHGTPRTPADLLKHACIALSTETTSACPVFLDSAGQTTQLALAPVYTINNTSAVLTAVLADMGFAIVQACSVAKELGRGALRRILADHTIGEPAAIAAFVCRNSHQPSLTIRAFLAYIANTDLALRPAPAAHEATRIA
jgi:DNA-binding transcriptional LysR family regulator